MGCGIGWVDPHLNRAARQQSECQYGLACMSVDTRHHPPADSLADPPRLSSPLRSTTSLFTPLLLCSHIPTLLRPNLLVCSAVLNQAVPSHCQLQECLSLPNAPASLMVQASSHYHNHTHPADNQLNTVTVTPLTSYSPHSLSYCLCLLTQLPTSPRHHTTLTCTVHVRPLSKRSTAKIGIHKEAKTACNCSRRREEPTQLPKASQSFKHTRCCYTHSSATRNIASHGTTRPPTTHYCHTRLTCRLVAVILHRPSDVLCCVGIPWWKRRTCWSPSID